MTIYELIGYSKEEVESVVQSIDKHYLSFPTKKSNGRVRWINAPLAPLKSMQNSILKNIVYKFTPHTQAFGFVKGKSAKDGATVHLGAKVLLCLDVQNFFGSLTKDRVFKLFTFLLNHKLLKVEYDKKDMINLVGLATYKGALPQGSPASPGLANLICLNLDKSLQALANSHNLKYSRYADDISFSSQDNAFLAREIMPVIRQTLRADGLSINSSKTRILRQHKRMMVTGVVVNKKLGTPKWVWKNLRAELHNGIKSGRVLTIHEYQKLRGQIEWIRTLHEARGMSLVASLGKLTIGDC